MRHKYIKQILSFSLTVFIFSITNLNTVASPLNLLEEKKGAYFIIAKDLYNTNNNIIYKLQALEKVAQLEGVQVDINQDLMRSYSLQPNKDKSAASTVDVDTKINYLKDKNYTFGYMLKDLSKSNDPLIKDFSRYILQNIDKKDSLCVFAEMVRGSEPEDRIIGIKGLAKINTDESANILINMLNSTSYNERLLITSVLCGFKSEQLRKTAIKMIKIEKDNNVRINLAIILVNNGDKTYESLLKDYSYSDDIENLRYLASKLKDIKGNVDSQIIQNLSYKSDTIIKLGLISYLDQVNYNNSFISDRKQFIKILKRYSFDNSNIVSAAAIKTLVRFPDKEVNRVIKPLIYDKQLSNIVINELLNANNKYLVQSIFELTNLDNDKIKFQAAKSLLDYGEKPKKLLRYLANNCKNIDIKIAAIVLLSKLDNTDKYIISFLNSNDDEIKKESKDSAVLYIANLRNHKIKEEKLQDILLDDSNKNNSLSAALLLYNYNNNSGYKILRNYLSARKPVIIPEKYNVEGALINLSEDSNIWVKVNSAYNLARVSNRRGIEVLRALLVSAEDSRVRASVATMLGNIGTRHDIDILKLAYNDKYCRVRSNAAESVLEIISRLEQSEKKENMK